MWKPSEISSGQPIIVDFGTMDDGASAFVAGNEFDWQDLGKFTQPKAALQPSLHTVRTRFGTSYSVSGDQTAVAFGQPLTIPEANGDGCTIEYSISAYWKYQIDKGALPFAGICTVENTAAADGDVVTASSRVFPLPVTQQYATIAGSKEVGILTANGSVAVTDPGIFQDQHVALVSGIYFTDAGAVNVHRGYITARRTIGKDATPKYVGV
jgi:hypothetical protein